MRFRIKGKKKILAGLFVLLTALPLASACSSGSGDSAASTDTGPAQEISVEMGDFYYNPGDIEVESGKVRFLLTNVGATAHRFTIKNLETDEVLFTTRNVGAGRDATLEVDLTAGNYKLGCTLGDHEARGAVGTLLVK